MDPFHVKNGAANALMVSGTTSSGRPHNGTEPADSRRPEGCPVDPLGPQLAMSRLEGRAVVRSPEQLRLHRALDELDLIDVAGELNEAARLKDQSLPEPVLITTNGTILAGFGRWRLALFERRQELHCIEYPLSEDESLQFILTHHQLGRGWNAFIRIRVALTLETHLQQRALDNMRAGGKYKGSANLPEAQHIDVRQEITRAAGVGARNVSNVKTIVQAAHPRLMEALRDGTLTINRAVPWCKLPKVQQLEQFTRYSWERATNKVIRQFTRLNEDKNSFNPFTVLDALQQQEVRQPGSVVVRAGRLHRTVILIGQDMLAGLHPQSASSRGVEAAMKNRDPLKQILSQTLSHWDKDETRPAVRQAFRKAMQCRTATLGAEVYASQNQERIVYHPCKGPACSSCGYRATVQWQRERWAALPDVSYKGITFTMPDVLWRLFRDNQPLTPALSALAAKTLQTWVNARYGLRIGIIAILHTHLRAVAGQGPTLGAIRSGYYLPKRGLPKGGCSGTCEAQRSMSGGLALTLRLDVILISRFPLVKLFPLLFGVASSPPSHDHLRNFGNFGEHRIWLRMCA